MQLVQDLVWAEAECGEGHLVLGELQGVKLKAQRGLLPLNHGLGMGKREKVCSKRVLSGTIFCLLVSWLDAISVMFLQ